jgi:hypothetical protein
MGAVAERLAARMLAATEGDAFGLGNLHLDGAEPCIFMGPITERLILGTTTPTPIVGPGLDLHHIRASLGNLRFLCHPVLPGERKLAVVYSHLLLSTFPLESNH